MTFEEKARAQAFKVLDTILQGQVNYPEVQEDVDVIAAALADAYRQGQMSTEPTEQFVVSRDALRKGVALMNELKAERLAVDDLFDTPELKAWLKQNEWMREHIKAKLK